MSESIPRLAASLIRRPRLEDWFGRFRSVPLRALVAPAGFGKTTALLSYARNAEANVAYACLEGRASAEDVWAAIGRAAQSRDACRSHEEAIHALLRRAPIEIALDFAGVPAPAGTAAIVRLVETLPESISMLVACRSRSAIEVGQLVARGLATFCDAERLAFDAAEIRHLAETCGVSHAHTDVIRLLDSSDGWPVVVSGAIRKAAEDGCDLAGAFDNWRTRYGHLFAEFVAEAMSDASPEEAELVRRLRNGSLGDDEEAHRALEIAGLFVIHVARGYRVLGALSRTGSEVRAASRNVRELPSLQVRMFGRFQAEIDGRPIEWIRRRDQQIFKYVALKRSGRATRQELVETFWPGSEKHLVAQSLRTAYCNIRKAIAKIVGFDAVDEYFRVAGDVSVNLDKVVVDVNRFVAHANDGDQQYDRNDLRSAYAHYRTAEQLYWGNLLIGDATEPWFAAQAAVLEDRHVLVLERLAEIAMELSDLGGAANYARRVVELRPHSEPAQNVLELVMRQARIRKTTAIALRRLHTPPAASIAQPG